MTKTKIEKRGRKPIITAPVLDKLEEAFKYGATDIEACSYADIGTSTLYKYQERYPGFAERKAKLKSSPIFTARKSVVDRLPRDPDLALKFLERKAKAEFSTRSETTGKDGGPVEVKAVEVMQVAPATEAPHGHLGQAKSDS